MKRIFITGPTASGKGSLALELARRLGGEIISVDSMKVYRRMDVGTAKPSAAARLEIPFHLIDRVEPWEDFSVGAFLPEAIEAARDIERRGKAVIFQGGTPLYLKALLDGLFIGPSADWTLRREMLAEAAERGLQEMYKELVARDPEAAQKIHPNDQRRIIRALEIIRKSGRRMTEMWSQAKLALEPSSVLLFGIGWERQALYTRINLRVERMIRNGLFEETRSLLDLPRPLSRTAAKCLGYRQIIEGLAAGAGREAMIDAIQQSTRRFAKQQLTWLRRFPIRWLAPAEAPFLAAQVEAEAAAGPPA